MRSNNYEKLLLKIKYLFVNKCLSIKEYQQNVNHIENIYKEICLDQSSKFEKNQHFYNKFFGEIKPLEILSRALNYDFIRKQSDNARIDAIFYKDKEEQFVECVLAIDGEQRSNEIEHLKTYGKSVQGIPIQTNSQTKANGKKEILETPNKWRASDNIKSELNKIIEI